MDTKVKNILKVVLWSGLSAFAVAVVGQLELVDWQALLGENYAALAVTAVNAIAYAVREYFKK